MEFVVLVLRHIEETDDAYVAGTRFKSWRGCRAAWASLWADNTDFVKEGRCSGHARQTTPSKRLRRKSQNGAGLQRAPNAPVDD